jgi:mannose-6-phosphate isomerase-like protein (cupin superfamily)
LKKETFYVESGQVQVLYGYGSIEQAVSQILNPGESFDVPIGLIHQIIAITESKVYEFSTTHYESDSYRIQHGD